LDFGFTGRCQPAFEDESLVIRITGNTIALTPPLSVSESEITEIFDKSRA
jgi:beta-alanine--pyruvate transaminase